MAQYGSLVIHTYTSRAQLPVAGATVAVAAAEQTATQKLEALLVTDSSGSAGPIRLSAADSNGLSPGGPLPYSLYSLWVEHPDYELVYIENLQIFAGVESVQNIALLPLAAPGGGPAMVDDVIITPQPL